jgi:hypothetical protein
MLEDFKWLTDLGPTGLLILLTAFSVVSIYRGWLVPRSVYRREQTLHDAARTALIQSITNSGLQNELLRQIVTELQKPAKYSPWGDTDDAPSNRPENYHGRHGS